MAVYAPTTIDLSRLATPQVIEPLDYEVLNSAFKTRFLAGWSGLQGTYPDLPDYDVDRLETDPVMIVGEAWSYLRLLDRQRVNDCFLQLLAAYAKGASLDAIAAARNIARLVAIAASDTTPAVMEGDAALLRRYLLSFDAPAAGSVGRYLYDAWTAWPQSTDGTLGLWDARVNGRAIHGRRGDTDVVVIGPFGRLPTSDELATLRAAVTHPDRTPEAVSVQVMAATRVEYAVDLTIEVPGNGPAPEIVKAEALARVTEAATSRILIGGQIPAGLLSGAAYGANVITVTDNAPVVIGADPYRVPVMTSLSINAVVRP